MRRRSWSPSSPRGARGPADLKQVLQLTDVAGGYHDAGIVDGRNKLVPSITFRLKKSIDDSLRPLSLNVVFKQLPRAGVAVPPGSPAETDFDESYVQSVPFDGNQTALLTITAKAGYTGDRAAVARRHAEELAVPGRARSHLRQAQLVAVGGDRAPTTFRARSWPSSVGVPATGVHLERQTRCRSTRPRSSFPTSSAAASSSCRSSSRSWCRNPTAMLGVWLAGGALAFAGAMAYAELAAVRPHAGGEYVYLRDAYGPLAAFLTGWTSFIAGFSGAIAASAVALADYVAPLRADAPPGAQAGRVDRRRSRR